MKYSIESIKQFKNDFKLSVKQGLDVSKLERVIQILADGSIKSEKKPLKLKVRNICGDETVVQIK